MNVFTNELDNHMDSMYPTLDVKNYSNASAGNRKQFIGVLLDLGTSHVFPLLQKSIT